MTFRFLLWRSFSNTYEKMKIMFCNDGEVKWWNQLEKSRFWISFDENILFCFQNTLNLFKTFISFLLHSQHLLYPEFVLNLTALKQNWATESRVLFEPFGNWFGKELNKKFRFKLKKSFGQWLGSITNLWKWSQLTYPFNGCWCYFL